MPNQNGEFLWSYTFPSLANESAVFSQLFQNAARQFQENFRPGDIPSSEDVKASELLSNSPVVLNRKLLNTPSSRVALRKCIEDAIGDKLLSNYIVAKSNLTR